MLNRDSFKKGIIVSTTLNIIGKLIAFINTLIITYYFGTQVETDIFFYIISVTALICNAINGVDLLVLVPEILRLRGQESEIEARRFVNFFFYSYIFIGLVFSILILSNPIDFYTTFSKFDIEKIYKYHLILKAGIGIIFFQLTNGLLTSVLTSYKFFTAPIIAGILNSLFTILFTVLLHDSIGIKGALVGILIGYSINFVLLMYTMYSKLQWNFFEVTIMKNKLVWKNIGLMQVNILPIWIRNYVTITLFSSMVTGTITALNIAQNIALIPEVFITSQIIAITGIKFSELNAANDMKTLKNLLDSIFIGLLLIMIPISIVFAICTKDIVSILYLRGNFDIQSLSVTAFCLFFLSILMPFKIPDSLFTRLFTSLQIYESTAMLGLLAHITIATMTYFLTIRYGLKGYFAALLGGYCIIMPIVFFLLMHFKAPTLKSYVLLKNLMYMAIISLITSIIGYSIYSHINYGSIINVIVITLVVSVPFWVSSYFCLDIESIKIYLERFTSKIKTIKL